ncbi:GTP-binding protein, partial [Nitrosomonas halophila]
LLRDWAGCSTITGHGLTKGAFGYPQILPRSQDIYRMKGILDIDSENRRFVFQGVHMLLDGRPGRVWQNDEPRRNELVFIGRHLSEKALKEGFRSCLAS